MNDKDYLIISTLGETRNITRAAERLFMTQSALSKRIKLIEQEFGCELLIRTHQGIFFTDAGEQVLAFCRSTVAGLNIVKQQLETETNQISGTLRIGYSISYGYHRYLKQQCQSDLRKKLSMFRLHYLL